MRLIAAFGFLTLLVVHSSSALAKGPYGSIKVGLWTGGAYTSEQTGAFTHCAAGSQYLNGVGMIITENAVGQWTVAFANPSFNLATGETFPIEATFDGQSHLRLFGKAVSSELVAAPLPSETLLRKSHLMVVEAQGATYQFQLKSVDRVVAAVANCVAKTKATGVANAGDFSLLATKPVVQATNTPAPNPASAKTATTVDRTGTGFVVSTNGHIITNNHVIDGCVGDIKGNLTGDASGTLRVVSTDEVNDLALLQAPKTFSTVPAIRATAVRSGDEIIAIGFPFHGLLTSDFTVTTGIVSSLSGPLNDTRYLQISAGVQLGNSGGPLLDTSGAVVGVVSSKLNAMKIAKATGDLPQNINFAVKTGAMRDFLDNSAVSYATADPKLELKTAEIAQRARAYTMLISCIAKADE